MAVWGDGAEGEPFRQCGETPCFHDGGIGLIKPSVGSGGNGRAGNNGNLVDAGCWAGVLLRFHVGEEGLLVVDAAEGGVGAVVMCAEPYEQFLAFVGGGHDVHLLHCVRTGVVEAFERFVPVEHG